MCKGTKSPAIFLFSYPDFMIYSGLKRDSAKAYLDSLCQGEHPRLRKVRESRRWLYFLKKDSPTE